MYNGGVKVICAISLRNIQFFYIFIIYSLFSVSYIYQNIFPLLVVFLELLFLELLPVFLEFFLIMHELTKSFTLVLTQAQLFRHISPLPLLNILDYLI